MKPVTENHKEKNVEYKEQSHPQNKRKTVAVHSVVDEEKRLPHVAGNECGSCNHYHRKIPYRHPEYRFLSETSEKAQSARIFKQVLDRATKDPTYAKALATHKEAYG